MLALTLSSLSPRATSDAAVVVIPAGTDTLRLQLRPAGVPPAVQNPRAFIQTVEGKEVWTGNAERAASSWTVEVPALSLAPEDYVVILTDADRRPADRELFRAFFRVRAARAR